MRCISAKSILTDPYRAGIEIGEALEPIAPEVILLFASMSYDPDFSEFFEALQDAVGNESTIIFGGTGDGIYETSGAENYGVSALGINSNGKVAWSVALGKLLCGSPGVRAEGAGCLPGPCLFPHGAGRWRPDRG